MKRFRYFLGIFVCILLFSCKQSLNVLDEVARWEATADEVTIIRDDYGVPHIYGKTDADVVFGLMVAQCEDDFNRVEVNYINAMGRMAEVTGEEDIFLDLRMKMYIDTNELKQEYQDSPEWLRKLMDGFADGMNYFLHTHPDVEPLLIDRWEPWMALSFTEGSIGGDIERISTRQLASFYGEQEQGNIEVIPEDQKEPSGSNGISIAPSLTANGNALFLINPHTSFFFRAEVHMISEEGLNAYGAVTWGQFFVYQGFNDRCGWMHTSSRADAIDYYAETIRNNQGALEYLHDNAWKPVTVKPITIPYKDGDSMASNTYDAYYTHHGPIIRTEDDKWISIALMKEHIKALTQSYNRTKARSYEDFKATMDLNTNSSNNTVYADADGTIAYFHGNFIPVRNENYNWSGVVDGSLAATDWQGLHTVEEMVLIKNPEIGWIQNCNATPFTASGEDSPDPNDYKSYMAPDRENYRGIHAVRVLEDQKDWTIDKLIGAAYDSYLPGFAELIPRYVNAYDRVKSRYQGLSRRVAISIELFRRWDYRFSSESLQTTLANYALRELMGEVRQKARDADKNIYDYMREDAEAVTILQSLDKAQEILQQDFGKINVPWGEVNRYQRITSDIRQPFNDDLPSIPVPFASGRWGSLASYGSRVYPDTKKWYGTSGNSFVAFVEFGDSIVARSILTGGQSGNPESPHFDDQAEMYTKAQFKDVAFYRKDVEKRAEAVYSPGKRN
ncbi:MAG: acylase [Saprospiraceae bacterium]|nr:acylase [Saprospiraceae bacterium]